MNFIQKSGLIIISLFLTHLSHAQVIVSGFVKDKSNKEILIGAYVYDSVSKNVVTTNINGYFSFTTGKKSNIICSYVGYKKQHIILNTTTDTLIVINLERGAEIDEVVVKSTKPKYSNLVTMSIKEIENIPVLGGQPDVMKAMQLMPGIQSQNEASSLLIVRGGDPGQNLYLLDNTPIIYVNHLGGFMSVFNTDMMNHVSVLKGGFPARYGGKISSIVKVGQRSGDASKRKGSFGVGLTDINGSIEGALGKKGSYIITARKTLFDALLFAATSISEGNSSVLTYGFYDINGKITWDLDKKKKLWFNFYQGDDYLNNRLKNDADSDVDKTKSKTVWGNWLLSGNLNVAHSPQFFSEHTLSYTRYRLKTNSTVKQEQSGNIDNTFISSVDDFTLRNNFNWQLNSKLKFNFGLDNSFLITTPYNYSSTLDSWVETKEHVNSFQNGVYAELNLLLLKKIRLRPGLRYVNYFTENFNDQSLEPRFNIDYDLGKTSFVNLSYMKTKQYAHLLFTPGSISSNEIWIPVTDRVPPSEGEQYTLSFSSVIFNGLFNVDLGTYYKEMRNLSTYKSTETSLMGNPDWESKIETDGKGISYGVEFFINKNIGNWKGSLSYCWSKTTRQYSEINNGKVYPFEFDRPHSLSLNVNKKINDKWEFTAVWIYQTGVPYTPAIGRQYTPYLPEQVYYDPAYYEALLYGERNSARLADYHRLDVGFKYNKLSKRGNRVVWNFSVYNLYNRHNPNYYYYNNSSSDRIHDPGMGNGFEPLDLYQISIFPILPSISYKVYFNGDNREKNAIKNRFKGFLYYEE